MLRAWQKESKKGMSAMERLEIWLNQQIAKIPGDLQELDAESHIHES